MGGRFFRDLLILSLSSLFTRGVGVVWNGYLSRRMGAGAMGLHSVVLNLYGFAVTIAVAGIGLAVTRLVSEREAEGDSAGAGSVVSRALLCVSVSGGGVAFLLLVCAYPFGRFLLGDAETAPLVRALALPAFSIAVSAVFAGYFTARRRAWINVASGLLELFLRIVLTLRLLSSPSGATGSGAVLRLLLGGGLAEAISALFLLLCYLLDRRGKRAVGGGGLSRRILSISVPVALSGCLRAGLSTLGHLLIPYSLCRSGIDRATALASYGTLAGMALPVVLYPMAILSSAASLLVPEFSRLHASGDRAGIVLLSRRTLSVTLCFSLGCFSVLAAFSEPLGRLLFGSADAGRFIAFLAPVVPVMFLDHVTDAALKGLGEQVAVMWINIADSALTVLLILFLLPRMGILGYILMIALTELFNYACSLRRLIRVSGYSPAPLRAIPPLLYAALACLFARSFLVPGVRSFVSLSVGGTATLALFSLPFLLLRRTGRKMRRDLDKNEKKRYNKISYCGAVYPRPVCEENDGSPETHQR